MIMEANHKLLYKFEILLVKLIPMLVSAFYVLNIIFSYFGLDNAVISAIVDFLFILFLYVSSYVFKFCSYHRMFIYYIVVHELLAWCDYIYVIPISNVDTVILHLLIAGLFLFVIIYLHNRNVRKNKKVISKASTRVIQ